LVLPALTWAEDLDAIFKKVQEMVNVKNYPKAIEELAWANKEIEKLHSQRIQTFLPDELSGYKGEKAQTNAALGILSLERNYKKGASEIRVSLTGGQGGSAGGALGGLAAFGRMAAMMGNGAGQDTFRISGRTAAMQINEGAGGELSVFLESGSVLKFETNDSAAVPALKAFAEALKVTELDGYLRGQG